MPLSPDRFKPTFPLDVATIQKMKRAHINGSPRLVMLRFAGRWAGKFRGTRLRPVALLVGPIAGRWHTAEAAVTLSVVGQLIHDSNRHQDQAITKTLRSLELDGKPHYAICLGRFLELKQRLEKELHHDGLLDDRKQSIEQLVDSICLEVCQELCHAAALQDSLATALTSSDETTLSELNEASARVHQRVWQAYQTLSDTADRLAMLLKPGHTRACTTQESQILDRLLEVLRDENAVAKVVDERIRSELPQI
ncbi:MAG: hypothetical protein KDB23_01650 [Planctomycetales bacterium]|nr:hypothetical protein [Planctomycetales bacterium]